jgi:hypothetical protein
MDQIMRELVRHVGGGALAPEQLKGLIRAGYVYRIGEDHIITDKGRDALTRSGVVTGSKFCSGAMGWTRGHSRSAWHLAGARGCGEVAQWFGQGPT